jgi:hypothetical protein
MEFIHRWSILMRNLLISPAAFCSLVAGLLLPMVSQAVRPPPGPCEQIIVACQNLGFIKGDAREGYGLYVDCVDPIMRGTQQPARADRPLPAVSADVVAACRQLRPNFGEGHRAPPHG